MLMSDTWQPAVLQLFPFSPNDASHPHHHHQHPLPPPLNLTTPLKDPSSSSFPLVKSVPATPEVSRGFPVLTPTRKEYNNGGRGSARMSAGGPGTGAGARDGEASWGSAPSPAEQKRASLDRVTASQPSLELGKRVTSSSSSSKPVRVKSEYVIHGRLSGGGKSARRVEKHGREKSDGLQSREQTTFSVTDMNERIIPRIGLRSDSTSPDSASRSLRNSPYMTSAVTQSPVPSGSGGNARSFSKPFLSSALSSSFTAAVRVTANGNGGAGEGRYVVSKNGMWRSVTLTPGEMELKKHRDLLERVTTSHPATEKGDSKYGQQYHKMSVRDLPRSTTPLNDHDPDKLNMKQVIAFLQSKGKSQADAMELPRGLKSNAHQAVMMPRTVKSSAFRGSVRRHTASSTTAELLMRSSVRDSARESRGPSPPSPAATHRGEDGGDALRTSSSLLLRRENTSRSIKSSGKEGKEQRRTRKQSALEQQESRAKLQKKPFRLHRFLTMVPTARDPDTPSSTSLVSSKTCPLYSAVPLMKPSSKSANKERTLCLDLANHSRTQVSQSRSADNKRQSNVHYRLAARPRPSSLRVEQDLTEAQWKLSADFGDRDIDRSVMNSAEHVNAKESKNVIRLPYVSVDSDNEDIGFSPESKRSARSQKHGRYVKTSCPNSSTSQKAEDKATKETEGVDSQWPVDVREVEEATSSQISTTAVKDAQELRSLTQVSTSSSMLPAPTESTSSLPTVSTGDILSELVHVEDESVDKLSVVLSERELVHSTEGNSVSDRNSETPVPSKKVSVNVPVQNDNAKGNATKQKLPDCVTLSLRKERHRTRENTYMSDIGGSDLLSDDTCVARVDSESLRMSLRGDDAASWMS